MPEVALVELPPKKAGGRLCQTRSCDHSNCDPQKQRTLLVKNDNISTSEVDGMRGAQSGHCESLSAAVGSAVVVTMTMHAVACDRAWDSTPGSGEWGHLQPPPTTMTLGAMVGDPLD